MSNEKRRSNCKVANTIATPNSPVNKKEFDYAILTKYDSSKSLVKIINHMKETNKLPSYNIETNTKSLKVTQEDAMLMKSVIKVCMDKDKQYANLNNNNCIRPSNFLNILNAPDEKDIKHPIGFGMFNKLKRGRSNARHHQQFEEFTDDEYRPRTPYRKRAGQQKRKYSEEAQDRFQDKFIPDCSNGGECSYMDPAKGELRRQCQCILQQGRHLKMKILNGPDQSSSSENDENGMSKCEVERLTADIRVGYLFRYGCKKVLKTEDDFEKEERRKREKCCKKNCVDTGEKYGKKAKAEIQQLKNQINQMHQQQQQLLQNQFNMQNNQSATQKNTCSNNKYSNEMPNHQTPCSTNSPNVTYSSMNNDRYEKEEDDNTITQSLTNITEMSAENDQCKSCPKKLVKKDSEENCKECTQKSSSLNTQVGQQYQVQGMFQPLQTNNQIYQSLPNMSQQQLGNTMSQQAFGLNNLSMQNNCAPSFNAQQGHFPQNSSLFPNHQGSMQQNGFQQGNLHGMPLRMNLSNQQACNLCPQIQSNGNNELNGECNLEKKGCDLSYSNTQIKTKCFKDYPPKSRGNKCKRNIKSRNQSRCGAIEYESEEDCELDDGEIMNKYGRDKYCVNDCYKIIQKNPPRCKVSGCHGEVVPKRMQCAYLAGAANHPETSSLEINEVSKKKPRIARKKTTAIKYSPEPRSRRRMVRRNDCLGMNSNNCTMQ